MENWVRIKKDVYIHIITTVAVIALLLILPVKSMGDGNGTEYVPIEKIIEDDTGRVQTVEYEYDAEGRLIHLYSKSPYFAECFDEHFCYYEDGRRI